MIVAGIMSGTSADGVDVAVVRVNEGRAGTSVKLLAHEGYEFPAELRRAVLAAMNAVSTSTAELARLNWRLGVAYAEAVKNTLKKHPYKVVLIGCHGQTVYHQPKPETYTGKKFACTWQLGEAAVIAAECGVPVVSNFRPADMVAGGEGAPLVPFLDYTLYASKTRARVLQNIGGIANLTAIPAGAAPAELLAFDTGPGNMVIDALAEELYGEQFDRGGEHARRGKVLEPVLKAALNNNFFSKRPPRTAGREQFGREYAKEFLHACRKESRRKEDALATATALTAESIARAYKRFVLPRVGEDEVDFVVSGGGARNRTLMQMLAMRLCRLGCLLTTSEEFGMPAEAKEAAAFALLAWRTWHRKPSNVPSATGAKRAVVLGQVTYV